MSAQTVESQATKIAELLATIAELKDTAKSANDKVERIATEAVQSASRSKIFVGSDNGAEPVGKSGR